MEMPEIPDVDALDGVAVPFELSAVLKKCPVLNDLLCCPAWSNGPKKGERAVLVFFKSGGLSAVLKVESPPLMLSVNAPTIDEALHGLELALKLDRVPWRRDENPLGRGTKKKK